MAFSDVCFALMVIGSNGTPGLSSYFRLSPVFIKVAYSHITFLKYILIGNNDRKDYAFQNFIYILIGQRMFGDQVVNRKVSEGKRYFFSH